MPVPSSIRYSATIEATGLLIGVAWGVQAQRRHRSRCDRNLGRISASAMPKASDSPLPEEGSRSVEIAAIAFGLGAHRGLIRWRLGDQTLNGRGLLASAFSPNAWHNPSNSSSRNPPNRPSIGNARE